MIYSLCDTSHVALYPWQRAGFECTSIDIAPCVLNDGINHVQSNILDIHSLPEAQFVLAFPPCTDLASSGSRWWQEKGASALEKALSIVHQCVKLIGETPGVLENPKGRLSTHYRKPNLMVHPHWFDALTTDDNAYTKETCLWLFNGARPPRSHPSMEAINTTYIHYMGKNRGALGSITPTGMANAIFLANFDYGH